MATLLPRASAGTLGDAVDNTVLNWTTGGDAPWFFQTATNHDGVDAAQSGGAAPGVAYLSTWIETTVTGRVAVVFWWKLDTDPEYYSFYFHTNDIQAAMFYGVHDWTPATVAFESGVNTLRWNYDAWNPNSPGYVNAAWLDQVVVTNIAGLKPTILAQPPVLQTVPDSYPLDTVLPVLVIGDVPMTFQWQHNNTNIADGFYYNNVTTSALDIWTARPVEAGNYQLVISNVWGAVTSAVSTVNVNPSIPFVWPTLPQDAELARGSDYELYTSVYGTEPIRYQWEKNGSPLSDRTNWSFSLNGATLADTGGYRFVVTNFYGCATSRVAQITVSTALPFISQGPSPDVQVAQPGDYASFYVWGAGPNPLSYEWRKIGSDDVLNTGQGVWFNPADPTNSGLYRVVLANNNGSITSRVSVLAVAPVTALGVALDAPQLVITNNYVSNWWKPDVSGTNAHDGLCAVRSPQIGDYDSGSFSTVVTGTNVSFWWRISAGAEAFLDIAVDGSVSNTISGETPWQQQTLDLPAGEHTLTWTFRKDAAGSAGEDAAWVDQLIVGAGGSVGGNSNEITNFTTGGDSDWFHETTNVQSSPDAWQSGPISNNGETWLRAEVTGPGTLSFSWSVDSQEYYDYLQFFIDGAEQTNISGSVTWQQPAFVLGDGPHELEWSYSKDGSASAGADAGWVDNVIWITNAPPPPPPTLAEAVDAPTLVFANDANWPWFGQTTNTYDGIDAAQSTAPPAGSQSEFSTVITGPGTLTFWAKISAAPEDVLQFYYNYQYNDLWYGESGWRPYSYEIAPGQHTVIWSFWKRSSDVAGLNAAFVDEISFTPRVLPTITAQPQSVKTLKGRSFALSVSAVSELPLTYQWLKGGTNIAGETDVSFSRQKATYDLTGNYSVIVSNSAGAVTSSVVRVAVVPCFYSARNLGTLKANAGGITWPSEAMDINNFGIVVGYSVTDSYRTHGFVWIDPVWIQPPTPAVMLDLGDGRNCLNNDPTNHLPGSSYASSISEASPGNQGDIVGWYEYRTSPSQSGYSHAAYWSYKNCGASPGIPIVSCGWDLYDVHPRDIYVYSPDTEAVAINSHGQILLDAWQTWVLAHYGYLLTPKHPYSRLPDFNARSIGVSGGSGWIDPYAMNNSGLVVGRYREYIGGDMPYLYDGYARIGNDAVSNRWSGFLTAVNDSGTIAGYVPTPYGGYTIYTPFIVHPDGSLEWLTDPLSNVAQMDVEPKHINNRNQVVGNGTGGMLYTDGHWFVLNDLVLDGLVQVDSANSINDSGQIVGAAWFPYGVGVRACLLTPTSAGQNQAPVAVNDEFRVSRPAALAIPVSLLLANDTDADGDSLSLISVGETNNVTQAGGKIQLIGQTINYTPPSGSIASDSFSYTISDAPGAQASARVNLVFDPLAPAAAPIINPPQPQADGTVLLSGNAPPGSVVVIYRTTDVSASYWNRDVTVTVPQSGQWSISRPGSAGGVSLFYKAEMQPAM